MTHQENYNLSSSTVEELTRNGRGIAKSKQNQKSACSYTEKTSHKYQVFGDK